MATSIVPILERNPTPMGRNQAYFVHAHARDVGIATIRERFNHIPKKFAPFLLEFEEAWAQYDAGILSTHELLGACFAFVQDASTFTE